MAAQSAVNRWVEGSNPSTPAMYTAFVHVPKTGGTSLYQYEKEINICNYSNSWHMSVSEFMKESHEHRFMTMVRDPYDVNLSMYYMNKRNGVTHLNSEKVFDEVFNRVDLQSLSADQYLDIITPDRVYKKYFDKKYPSYFDIVGTMEQPHKTFKLLSAIFETKMDFVILNNNPNRYIYEKYKTSYSREEFMEKNDLDYELYFAGIDRFNELCKKYNI